MSLHDFQVFHPSLSLVAENFGWNLIIHWQSGTPKLSVKIDGITKAGLQLIPVLFQALVRTSPNNWRLLHMNVYVSGIKWPRPLLIFNPSPCPLTLHQRSFVTELFWLEASLPIVSSRWVRTCGTKWHYVKINEQHFASGIGCMNRRILDNFEL